MTDPVQARLAEAQEEYERRLAEYEAALGPRDRWNPADHSRISRQLLIETGLADATAEALRRAGQQEP